MPRWAFQCANCNFVIVLVARDEKSLENTAAEVRVIGAEYLRIL
jgi:short-subunit dehydrogenase